MANISINDTNTGNILNDPIRNKIKFVSILLCWGPNSEEKMQYIIWKKKKPPFGWTIPKMPLVNESEREGAVAMLKEIYTIDTDIVTPPMDRYVQIYKKKFKIHEVNFFLVKVLDMDTAVRIPKQCSGFSMTSLEDAIKNLQKDINRNAVRFYDSCVVPNMTKALSLIGEEQVRKAFTDAAKEKKQDRDLFKERIISLSCLMSGKSLDGVMTSPKYQHPFSTETWRAAILKLSKLGIE